MSGSTRGIRYGLIMTTVGVVLLAGVGDTGLLVARLLVSMGVEP